MRACVLAQRGASDVDASARADLVRQVFLTLTLNLTVTLNLSLNLNLT